MRESVESVPENSHVNLNQNDLAFNKRHVAFVPSIQEHRERVAKVQSSLTPAKVHYIDLVVPLSAENVKIPVRIYLPKFHISGTIPTLFYFPGTGFIANERSVTHMICSHLCEKTQCQLIEIRSRLAPENPFPIGFQDAYEVFTYFVTKCHHYYHIDPQKIAIVGYSSGGNFAALVGLKAAQDHLFIRRQILISPMVDLSRSLKTFIQEEEKDTTISESFLQWIIDLYASDKINLRDPAMSPFWEKKRILQQSPPTDILIGEWDRTRSDAELYHQKLQQAGAISKKFVAVQQDHSCLWHNIQITEKIAECIHLAFQMEPMDPLFRQHRLYFLNLMHYQEETEKGSEKNMELRAKL